MAEQAAGKPPDTTLYRIEKGVGFNVRVEPIRHTYRKLESRMGFMQRWREKRRLKRMIGEIEDHLRASRNGAAKWDTPEGECVCNLRVAKMGLVGEFKRYAKNAVEADPSAKWPHLMALRDRPCLMLPVDFPKPFLVNAGEEEPHPVASAPQVKAELASVNQILHIDETFAIKKMVDYLDATERDISIYESRFGTYEGFWPKFSYVLLKKLADTSVEKGLPAIFA